MCGRFAASVDLEELETGFDIDEVVGIPRLVNYNVAPTEMTPVVFERSVGDEVVRRLADLRWGLVPSWSRDARGAARLINARVETVAEKPSFKRALVARRCLVPAMGYYEWYQTEQQGRGGRPLKQPFFLYPTDGSVLAMAGLYEFWRDPEGQWLTTFAIITTAATDNLGHLHDRMPMTVAEADRDAWLDPGLGQQARDLLIAPGDLLEACAVSTAVNQVANKGPELIEPLAISGE